jgi:superoxide dismutase, Fe-Mn family
MKSTCLGVGYIFTTLLSVLGITNAGGPVNESNLSGPSDTSQSLTLPPLPYSQNALESYISQRTMSFHYGKHHQAYLDNLNKLIGGTTLKDLSLEELLKTTSGLPDKVSVFNNAAQLWNHTFFWQSMKAGGGGKPVGRLMKMIEQSFRSYDEFETEFVTQGTSQFGSGWIWLVQDGESLKILKTSNAENPLTTGQNPLLTCDLWEHAYYLDYQNRRKDFLRDFLEHLVNWQFAASCLK